MARIGICLPMPQGIIMVPETSKFARMNTWFTDYTFTQF